MTNTTHSNPAHLTHPAPHAHLAHQAHQAHQVPQHRPVAPAASFAPPSPYGTGPLPPTWSHPPAVTVAPSAPVRAARRRTWLLAGAAAVVVSTMASVVGIAQLGDDRVGAAAVSAVDDSADTDDTRTDAGDQTGAAGDTPTGEGPGAPVDATPAGDPTNSQPAETGQPEAPATESTSSAPPVVLPTDTAAPATTTAPTPAPAPAVVAHSLASVQAGDCLLDGALMACHRGVDLVTHVATSDRDCFDGETIVTVTQSGATPEQVIVCVVPYALDDRTLPQAFTVDQSCGTAAASDLLTFEIDGLVCTSSSGLDYLLVKVAEGQMVTYLTDVLAAEFLGDFTADDGQVCGGHYRIDGWDVYVFGYGPFVEFRQFGDADGIRFSRSLCAA